MYIEKINDPYDLKKMTLGQCTVLADEIRKALLETVSATGGHLSSNLGIIEATIALHYVFDSPKDKLIFDTSHQCYTHKILTGRKDAFLETRYYNKYSGYTNPDESIHDYFKFGHTSTSISLACGLAKARDLKNGKENIIAIIGDGSLSGGEALEGLNYAGSEIKSNLIILLNDNQMSIAENHGGIYQGLKILRETKGNANNNIFKFLGYEYRFLENGNNILELVDILQQVKDTNHPIVIHICTEKGKGYVVSEKNREDTHFVKPFDLEIGDIKKVIVGERYDVIVREYLIEKMKKDSNIVAITPAMPVALSFSENIRRSLGKQYVDVGIAEEHAISMAGGIAKNGGKPVLFTRSTFFQRAYDQISQELCINNLAVTMILVNASIYATTDMTHIGIYDIAMMSNIPNLVMLSPTNKQEYLAMLEWSIEQKEYPVAIRAPRNGVHNAKYAVDTDYSLLNKFQITVSGKEIAVIAIGDFFQLGEEVVEMIKKEMNINASLINPRYVTGIDEELLREISKDHKLVITLEDGILDGGFGQKIASFYGTYSMKVMNYGFEKSFFDNYDVKSIMTKNRLNPELILKDIEKMKQSLKLFHRSEE